MGYTPCIKLLTSGKNSILMSKIPLGRVHRNTFNLLCSNFYSITFQSTVLNSTQWTPYMFLCLSTRIERLRKTFYFLRKKKNLETNWQRIDKDLSLRSKNSHKIQMIISNRFFNWLAWNFVKSFILHLGDIWSSLSWIWQNRSALHPG